MQCTVMALDTYTYTYTTMYVRRDTNSNMTMNMYKSSYYEYKWM